MIEAILWIAGGAVVCGLLVVFAAWHGVRAEEGRHHRNARQP
jgi:hypothetical protein